MKILIFGYTGMFGSQLIHCLSKNKEFSIIAVGRFVKSLPYPRALNIFEQFDAISDLHHLKDLIRKHRPDVIINCLGVVKQRQLNSESLNMYQVNAVFPRVLADCIRHTDIKMIQISTDCVFDGVTGRYVEDDMPNAKDSYGISKYLGELINYDNVLTLRTSFIGHEWKQKSSLLEWFIAQKGDVQGYVNCIYNGLTTLEVATIIADKILTNFKPGLYHLSGEEINKYELLRKIQNTYRLDDKVLKPQYDISINRSLSWKKFGNSYEYKPKTWDQLLIEMHNNFLDWRA